MYGYCDMILFINRNTRALKPIIINRLNIIAFSGIFFVNIIREVAIFNGFCLILYTPAARNFTDSKPI